MGTVNAGLFTSTTDEWPTPPDLFATLNREFDFDLDPAASADNALCRNYFTRDDDGLAQRWHGAVYMNPPYGRQMRHWIAKAHNESQSGATVVCLIPARTDTSYWHDYVMRAAEVRMIRGRLHFDCDRQRDRVEDGQSKAHNAPFPSVVVVFRPGYDGPPAVSAIDRSGAPLDAYPANT